MNFPFLKKETFGLRVQETFIGNKCEIFLPEYFFNKNDPNAIALEIGEKVSTMGLFWFRVDEKDLYELQLPLKFEFEFSDSYKKKVKLQPQLPETNYYVYVLNKGDAFVYDVLHKKDLDDFTIAFLSKMIEGAKLPPTTAYSDAFPIFLSAMKATGVMEVGVSATSLELLLSELYRDKKNMKEPFRKSYKGNEYDYRMVRIIKVPELNSTFTSLLGEDIQNQLAASILRQREGIPDRESPVEKIIKF